MRPSTCETSSTISPRAESGIECQWVGDLPEYAGHCKICPVANALRGARWLTSPAVPKTWVAQWCFLGLKKSAHCKYITMVRHIYSIGIISIYEFLLCLECWNFFSKLVVLLDISLRPIFLWRLGRSYTPIINPYLNDLWQLNITHFCWNWRWWILLLYTHTNILLHLVWSL